MRRNEDYVPRRENYQEGEKPDELSPEVKERVELLNERLHIVETIFKLAPDKAFDEALKELTLQPKEKDVSDEEKKLFGRYKGEIIKLIADHYHYLPSEKQKLFEELCIKILAKK